MKKLDRGHAPACLAQFKHGREDWSVISKNGLTNDIWDELCNMQHGYCAYCECKLPENNKKRHVEHFIQKSQCPTLTFSWDNLFGSCNNPDRCGKYKDHSSTAKRINIRKVCKPDVNDPKKLLIFLKSGKVTARSGLTAKDSEIAHNTIAIFNLDGDSTLENSRKAAIAGEKHLADDYWEALANDTGNLAELLETELSDALIRIKNLEHSTALECLWRNG